MRQAALQDGEADTWMCVTDRGQPTGTGKLFPFFGLMACEHTVRVGRPKPSFTGAGLSK